MTDLTAALAANITPEDLARIDEIMERMTAENREQFGMDRREAFTAAFARFTDEEPELALVWGIAAISRSANDA